MDLILEQDKLSSLNNNNNNNNSLNNNNNIINNNPAKGIGDGQVAVKSVAKDGGFDNNNHLADSSPISVSPTISETIYEFGSQFDPGNPSHVISEKVRAMRCILLQYGN